MSGNYECKCFHCRSVFYGHKHETTCPTCAKKFKEFQEQIILEKAIEINNGLHSETAALRERVKELEERAIEDKYRMDTREGLIGKLQAENAALREKLNRAIGSFEHDYECPSWPGSEPAKSAECSCGYNELISSLKEGE